MLPMLALIVAVTLLIRHVPTLLTDVVATAIGVILELRSRQLCRRLIDLRDNGRAILDVDHKPSWAERRLMKNSLRVALHQTELMSLLPCAAIRAMKIADWLDPKQR